MFFFNFDNFLTNSLLQTPGSGLLATFSIRNSYDFITFGNIRLQWRVLVDGMPVGRATGNSPMHNGKQIDRTNLAQVRPRQ